MGLFGGTQASVQLQLPDAPRAAWRSLRLVVEAHPKVVSAAFNDVTMTADFKTDESFSTYGQSMSAVVSSDESGTTVLIEGVAKQRSTGGRDAARIRKIAGELLSDLQARLFQAALVEPESPQPSRHHPYDPPLVPVSEEIAKLELLRAKGFISTDEFEDHKRRLLDGEVVGRLPVAVESTRGPQRPARERYSIRFVR
jgi:hypothetical protein